MGAVAVLTPDALEIAVDGYSADEIEYHLSLLQEEGLIESPGTQPMVGVTFRRLTSPGHDFLESQANDENWGRGEETGKEQNMARKPHPALRGMTREDARQRLQKRLD